MSLSCSNLQPHPWHLEPVSSLGSPSPVWLCPWHSSHTWPLAPSEPNSQIWSLVPSEPNSQTGPLALCAYHSASLLVLKCQLWTCLRSFVLAVPLSWNASSRQPKAASSVYLLSRSESPLPLRILSEMSLSSPHPSLFFIVAFMVSQYHIRCFLLICLWYLPNTHRPLRAGSLLCCLQGPFT